VAANSLNALNDNLARIIGPAIGGLLLGVWGVRSVVLADAVSYLFAALLIGWIGAGAVETVGARLDVRATVRAKFIGVWREWSAGLKLMKGDRMLSRVFLVVGVAMFADAILSAILVVFMQEDAGLNATQFGWLLTARGVGGLVGGLLIAQVGQKLANWQLAAGGMITVGLLLVTMVAQPTLYVLLILIGLIGVPSIAWIVAVQTQLQQATADEYRGRVFGAYGTSVSLLMLVSSGLAGLSADMIGATALVLIAAVISIMAGLMAGVLLRQPVRAETVMTAASATLD
jgi:predicted MFS family arabinose efflux permease